MAAIVALDQPSRVRRFVVSRVKSPVLASEKPADNQVNGQQQSDGLATPEGMERSPTPVRGCCCKAPAAELPIPLGKIALFDEEWADVEHRYMILQA